MTNASCGPWIQTLGALFECSPHGDYQRIRTPFLYPDGDSIDLFAKQTGGVWTITDLGETLRWLRMQSLSPKRSPKQQAIIEDVALNHGVEFFKGMLVVRCSSMPEYAPAVMRLAQAALRVADLWFSFRNRAVQSVVDEVADFLTERSFPYERGERLVGRSGKIWTPDFHVRVPARSSLVYVLTTGSRSASRPIVEHVLTAWYDLNQLTAGPEGLHCVSLFDDTADVWSDEDFRLVEPLSEVVRWSAPDEFGRVLAQAA
ncbi:MAG TPA: DUF1828 domain-containing protein [Candidatus Hydrogenedentes bacterium]|nr:DUF1828 domain-containing protein [Candidatus Hydrogenedentota bacterium]